MQERGAVRTLINWPVAAEALRVAQTVTAAIFNGTTLGVLR